MSDTEDLITGVKSGSRRALARLITRIESTRSDHRKQAAEAIAALLPETGKSLRVGISGVPGVGKSSFIETFGLHLIAEGHRVAVLAVDPSSPKHGGSILGDKTRMENLARHADALFAQPLPQALSAALPDAHAKPSLPSKPAVSTWFWWKPSASASPNTP